MAAASIHGDACTHVSPILHNPPRLPLSLSSPRSSFLGVCGRGLSGTQSLINLISVCLTYTHTLSLCTLATWLNISWHWHIVYGSIHLLTNITSQKNCHWPQHHHSLPCPNHLIFFLALQIILFFLSLLVSAAAAAAVSMYCIYICTYIG